MISLTDFVAIKSDRKILDDLYDKHRLELLQRIRAEGAVCDDHYKAQIRIQRSSRLAVSELPQEVIALIDDCYWQHSSSEHLIVKPFRSCLDTAALGQSKFPVMK